VSHIPYPHKRPHPRRYIFISEGRLKIEKVVDFQSTGIRDVMNLSFGDLLPDGSVDDKVNSNNGDLLKVMATVVDILKSFTTRYPEVEVFFTGSTDERTKLYTRILKTYHSSFNKEFAITAITGTEKDNDLVPFNPAADQEYLAFLIKRIN
jgi:hypothetical protein